MSGTVPDDSNGLALTAATIAATGLSRYQWLPDRALFYDQVTRKVVPPAVVRSALDDAIDASARNVRAITQQLRLGEVTLAEWQRLMMAEIKASQLAGVAAASGGFENMTQSRYGLAGRRIRDQYAALAKFAQALSDGTQKLDGTALRRAELYAKSARATYHDTETRELSSRGYDEEASVLGDADHCGTCVSEAERGFVPLGQMIPIGARDCLGNCKCRRKLRNSVTGAVYG